MSLLIDTKMLSSADLSSLNPPPPHQARVSCTSKGFCTTKNNFSLNICASTFALECVSETEVEFIIITTDTTTVLTRSGSGV